MNNLEERVLEQVKELLPQDRVRKEYHSLYGGMLTEAAKTVIEHLPDDLEINIDENGALVVSKKEQQPASSLDEIIKLAQVNLTPDEIPTFKKLFENTLYESELKNFVK